MPSLGSDELLWSGVQEGLVMGSHRGCGVTQVLLVTVDAACPPSEPLPALPAPAPAAACLQQAFHKLCSGVYVLLKTCEKVVARGRRNFLVKALLTHAREKRQE